MIKNFLIISCIGKNDKIGLRANNNFYIHDFNKKLITNDQLLPNIMNLIKKHRSGAYWSHLPKLKFECKTKAGTHVQSQTHFFEFDLSLTTIKLSIENQCRSACTKLNLTI